MPLCRWSFLERYPQFKHIFVAAFSCFPTSRPMKGISFDSLGNWHDAANLTSGAGAQNSKRGRFFQSFGKLRKEMKQINTQKNCGLKAGPKNRKNVRPCCSLGVGDLRNRHDAASLTSGAGAQNSKFFTSRQALRFL